MCWSLTRSDRGGWLRRRDMPAAVPAATEDEVMDDQYAYLMANKTDPRYLAIRPILLGPFPIENPVDLAMEANAE